LAVVLWHHAIGVVTLLRLILIGVVVGWVHHQKLNILLSLVAVVAVLEGIVVRVVAVLVVF
jgi:hypothetical protein